MASPYETLGVAPDADVRAIKKAYRRLARDYHPDVVGPAERERFMAVTRAYKLLTHPLNKGFYDRFGQDPVELGLTEELVRRALHETRPKTIRPKVPRSECTDCEGTGIRRSGRVCASCDPHLPSATRSAPADIEPQGSRVRLKQRKSVRRPTPTVSFDDLVEVQPREEESTGRVRLKRSRKK